MYEYAIDLIDNNKEQEFVDNFNKIAINCKHILIKPQVVPILIKYDLFFSNLKLLKELDDVRFVFILLRRIHKLNRNYVNNNLFRMLYLFDDWLFYYYFIAFCWDNNVDIKEVLKYIEDNKIILSNNGLIKVLKENVGYKYINEYLDLFINNSISLIELKKLFEQYSFPSDKLDILLKKMDNNPNLIRNEMLMNVISLNKVKTDKIVDFIDIIIKELLDFGNLNYHNIKYINAGSFSTVYQFGDKVLKIGTMREAFSIRDSKYFLKPLYRTQIMDKNDIDFLFTFEITEYVDTAHIDRENTYQIYKNLRDEGLVWTDCRECNIGRLLKDNKVYFDGISKVDRNSTGYLTENDECLKAGDLVVIDNDFIYDEDVFFKNQHNYHIPSEYFYSFEDRYNREKKMQNKL